MAFSQATFYMAHARFKLTKDAGIWSTANKSFDATTIHVCSPLVNNPVAVRYGWATSPMGNLKVNGKEWLPLASFRTDEWEWPESEDPEAILIDRTKGREINQEAEGRCSFRRNEEARTAVEILERLDTLHEAGNRNGSPQ